jgi:hypothetical protein
MGVRVLVLVLSLDREPWKTIEMEGQRATWASPHAEEAGEIPTLFYYGLTSGLTRLVTRAGGKALRLPHLSRLRTSYLRATGSAAAKRPVVERGDRIFTQVPETYVNVGAKTLAAFGHVLANHRFDFLFRTNTSSYVNRKMLRSFAETLPTNRYYGGFVGHADGVSYASGTGILMSRDLVEMTVRDQHWDFDRIDDIAIGHSMLRAGVGVHELPRLDVVSRDALALLTPDSVRNCFWARCRSSGDRRQDIETMHRVHAMHDQAGLL